MQDRKKLEVKILKHIKKDPRASVRDLQKTIGYNSAGSTQHVLNRMIHDGRLKRIPSSWEIL